MVEPGEAEPSAPPLSEFATACTEVSCCTAHIPPSPFAALPPPPRSLRASQPSSTQMDPCCQGHPFSGHVRQSSGMQIDPMDSMGGLQYGAGATDSLMGSMESGGDACRFPDGFLRDVAIAGDPPSPFFMDEGDPGIPMGGTIPDPVYIADDRALVDDHRRVKMEMDIDQGVQMGGGMSYPQYRQINVEPRALQSHFSTPSKLFAPTDDPSDLHTKRICMQEMKPGTSPGCTRYTPAGYQFVRASTTNSSGWAIQPIIAQTLGTDKEGLEPVGCISTGFGSTAYAYRSPHSVMSPVTRRHSTGSANAGHPLGSLPSGNPGMLPVQEHSVTMPVPIMGPGGSFRVNSAPVPYDNCHKMPHLDNSYMGSPKSLCKDHTFMEQMGRESSRDENRVRRRVHKKRENLPKESTALLKEWLLSHMMLPYPGNEEKLALCKATNLDMSQINNWFINARVRIWKPLVREVFDKYSDRLMQQAQEDKDEHQLKRIQDAHKATTMNMITLLSGLQTARRELDEIATKSKAVVKEV